MYCCQRTRANRGVRVEPKDRRRAATGVCGSSPRCSSLALHAAPSSADLGSPSTQAHTQSSDSVDSIPDPILSQAALTVSAS